MSRPTYTNQEVFDRVATHLLKQGRKALAPPSRSFEAPKCMYRLECEDGTVLRCAVGCLIPDDRYEERIENKTFRSAEVNLRDFLEFEPTDEQVRMLELLQMEVHDIAAPEDWPMQLRALAKEFGLSTVAMDALVQK